MGECPKGRDWTAVQWDQYPPVGNKGFSKFQGKRCKAQAPGQGPSLPGSESGTGQSAVPPTMSRALEPQETRNAEFSQS